MSGVSGWVSSGLIKGERHESNERDLERDHQAVKSSVLTGYCSLFSSSSSPEFYPVSLEMSVLPRGKGRSG